MELRGVELRGLVWNLGGFSVELRGFKVELTAFRCGTEICVELRGVLN